jgi:hypothetical protein
VLEVWSDLTRPCPLVLNSTFVRRELLFAAGGFPAMRQAGDLATAMRVACLAPGVMRQRSLFWYRQHGAQMSTNGEREQWEARERQLAWEQAAALFQRRDMIH